MKGQLFSIDFMIGLAIFLITMVLIFFLTVIKPGTTGSSMQAKANQIADFLVITKLGTENVLSCHKVTNFSTQSYGIVRNETGVSPFDIYVEFKNNTNICSGNQTSIGMIPSTSTTTVSVVRIVNLYGQKMQMIVRLYD